LETPDPDYQDYRIRDISAVRVYIV